MDITTINTWAVKKWSEYLNPNNTYDIDINTFLVTSLVPFASIYIKGGTNYIAIELEDIRKITAVASNGFKQIVDSGYGIWLEYTETPKEYKSALHDCSVGVLAIGTLKGINKASFYMDTLNNSTRKVEAIQKPKRDRSGRTSTTKIETAEQPNTPSVYTDTLKVIDECMVNYLEYAKKNGAVNKANQIYRGVTEFINTCKTRKPRRDEFYNYLSSVNAIVNDLHSINKGSVKELATSTKVLNLLTKEEVVGIIPYYVLHFHEIARKGQYETNIYNLSFQLTTILQKYRTSLDGKTSKKYERKQRGYTDDSL